MKRQKHYLIFSSFFSVIFGFCLTQNTFAAMIDDAWVNGNSGIDSDGGTTFYVSFDYGSSCYQCEQYSSFRCSESGEDFTTSICSWNVSYSSSTDTWKYYSVDLYPCNSDQQNISGTIRSKRWGYLYAYAIDQDGNLLNNGNSIDNDWAYYGDRASVSRHGYNPDGYTPTNKWKWYNDQSNSSTEDPFESHTMNQDKNTYVIYNKNIVEGLSKIVAGGEDKTNTGWQSSGNTTADTYFINNCSPTNGCSATFRHYLRRTSGTGSSDYSIKRTSNYWVSSRTLGIEPKDPLANGTETFPNGNDNNRKEYDQTLTLYPGQIVCEKLTFNNNPGTDSTASTKACASALGKAQPDDPSNQDAEEDPGSASGDTSFVNIKVRNQTVTKYNKFQRSIYAKPTDTLAFRATYNPVLQYTYYLKPRKMRINSGTIYPTGDDINTSHSLGKMFNDNKGDSMKDWSNSISVFSSNFAISFSQNYTYSNGYSNKRSETNEYEVKTSEVGRTLSETVRTNRNDDTKTTPSQVTFSNSSGNNLGNVSTTYKSKAASAIIPYNFTLTTKLSDSNNGKILYAGDTTSFTMNVTVNPKTNSLTTNNTNDKYATTVSGGKRRFKFCINGHFSGRNCGGEAYVSKDYSDSSFSMSISTTDEMNNGKTSGDLSSGTIIVPDRAAGTEICVVSLVYPKNSGSNSNIKTDYYDINDEANWAVSPEKCFKVAKKPSLQIWGGNIYSNSKINTAISKKVTLNGYPDGTYVFGSWGELGVISNGEVRGLASGAGTGYSGNNNGTLTATPGGANSANFCNVSSLSFANTNCSNGYVGLINSTGTGSAASNVINKDKDAIKNKFSFKGSPNVSKDENVSLNTSDKINASNIYYYYSKENFNLAANTVNASTIQVVESDKDVTITGNLTYENTTYYLLRNEGIGNNISTSSDYLWVKGSTSPISIRLKVPEGNNGWNWVEIRNSSNIDIADLSSNVFSCSTEGTDNLSVICTLPVSYLQSLETGIYSIIAEGDQNGTDRATFEIRDKDASASFIPKLIIMAKNIKINCNVSRIDGVLIADDTITTCADSDDINAQKNSRQLKINGAIITGKLVPNRTYGSSYGNYSIIPAEIINFDPSLYLWGELGDNSNEETGEAVTPTDGSGGSGGDAYEMNITYTRELPPRL